MTKVFESLWLEKLHKTYSKRLGFQQPVIYHVATHSKWADKRTMIENWVSQISQEKREAVIQRLRHPDHFFTTYNELLVGDVLRSTGYKIEYERPLGRKTPDWYVFPRKEFSAFIVEVTTILPSETKQKEAKAWDELRSRIGQIHHYFHLFVDTHKPEALIGKDIKVIAGFVADWLNSFSLDEVDDGNTTTYNDGDLSITFKLLLRKTKDKKPVSTAGPAFAGWVNTEQLRDSITKKLRKYSQAKELGVPLVVAIIPTFETGMSVDVLLDVLFGREQLSVTTGEMSRDRTGMVIKHNHGVLLNTGLSAVMFLEQSEGAQPKIIHNPYSINPIPPSTFANLRNFVMTSKDGNYFEMDWITPIK